MIVDKEYCMSSFLMYRRVVDTNRVFSKKCPIKMEMPNSNTTPIRSSFELEEHIKSVIERETKDGNAALALSGGIDSAIMAKFFPKGSTAYTFKCVAGNDKVVDETNRAAFYAKQCGLKHRVIEITWDDMKKYSMELMSQKGAPIHSIEVQIFMGALQAKKDGFSKLVFGETADVKYGGLSNILSKDWKVGEFIERYAYLKPWMVLKNPKVDFSEVLRFSQDGFVDVHKYLSEFDIVESINSYYNACNLAGISFVAPYASTHLDLPLDYNRIRQGENKYLIREIFDRLYKDIQAPEKIPMPRATEQWLKNWNGPTRREFLENCVNSLTGDEKWLLWSLEQFLNIIDVKEAE